MGNALTRPESAQEKFEQIFNLGVKQLSFSLTHYCRPPGVPAALLNVHSNLTQKLCSGLVRVQCLYLLHMLCRHGNPLLGWLLFEERCGDVLR